jgi:hypothetical protein
VLSGTVLMTTQGYVVGFKRSQIKLKLLRELLEFCRKAGKIIH